MTGVELPTDEDHTPTSRPVKPVRSKADRVRFQTFVQPPLDAGGVRRMSPNAPKLKWNPTQM